MSRRNNLLFLFITAAVMLAVRSIIMRLIKTEPWHAIPDTTINVFIIAAMFMVLLAIYKDKLIRNSFFFLFMSYCLEYLANFMPEGSKAQFVSYISALSLLPFAFIYALKYWRIRTESDELRSVHRYHRQIFLIIVAIVLVAIIFIWYSRPLVGT